jgi:stage V sporulation protein AA
LSEIYIQLKNSVQIDESKKEILVRDIAKVIAPKPCIVGKIKVYTLTNDAKSTIIISALEVIKKIQKQFPNSTANIVGTDYTIVQIKQQKSKASIFLVALAWVVLYFGAGLTIMSFHVDVDMSETHQNIHYYLTGETNKNPYWLQIPYSIGIGLGMIVFFNHAFKKKINKEPSPLEVEMFLYQDNIDKYLISQFKSTKNKDDG